MNGRRDLQMMRLYYFVLYGSWGLVLPFVNLFYVQLGLRGWQAGVITGAMALVTLVAAPMWVAINERWHRPQVMLQGLLLVTGLGYLWLTSQTMFWGVLAVSVFRAVFWSGVQPFSDALALSVTDGRADGYGSIRLWGTIGYGLVILLSGWFIEQMGLKSLFVGACMLIVGGAVVLLSIRSLEATAQVSTTQKVRLRTVLGKLVQNRAMMAALLMVVVVGVANNGVIQFEMVYLQTLGAAGALLAIAGMIPVVAEVPAMLLADRIARKRGAFGLLPTSMCLYMALRCMVLLSPSVPLIMAVRLVSGFAFGFYAVGLVRFTAEQVASSETRMVLAFYMVTVINLVGMVASPVAGMAYDGLGPRSLYLIEAFCFMAAWLCLRRAAPGRVPDIEKIPLSQVEKEAAGV